MSGIIESEEAREDEVVLVEADLSELKHISFPILSVSESESRISCDQFRLALEGLYSEDYVLVDVYDIVNISEEGVYSYKDTITIPEGKKPLLISQSDICYPMNSAEMGIADKLVLKGETIAASYTAANGTAQTGEYDLVPILESFISAFPDFSYDGARAVLGVSGYAGVAGHRTTSYFAETDGNPYAAYGTYDVYDEQEDAAKVIDTLKELGYHFASAGFDGSVSYGAEYSIVEEDAESWVSEVVPVIGKTDIIILPRQTDIASWQGYSDDNEKYALLKKDGFDFFFIANNSTPYLMQVSDSYVRQMYYSVTTYLDFENALAAE